MKLDFELISQIVKQYVEECERVLEENTNNEMFSDRDYFEGKKFAYQCVLEHIENSIQDT